MHFSGDEYCQCCTRTKPELCHGCRYKSIITYRVYRDDIVTICDYNVDLDNLPPLLQKIQIIVAHSDTKFAKIHRITNLPYYIMFFELSAHALSLSDLIVSNKPSACRVSQFYKILVRYPFYSFGYYNYTYTTAQKLYRPHTHSHIAQLYYISRKCECYASNKYTYSIITDYLANTLQYTVYLQSHICCIPLNDNLPISLLHMKHIQYGQLCKMGSQYGVNSGCLLDIKNPLNTTSQNPRNLPLKYSTAVNS
jgi:hypothetical protein